MQKTEHEKISDRKFSQGEDIWTNEIPQLKFEDENTQKEYDNFIRFTDVIIRT